MDLGYTLAVSRVKFLAGKSVRASLIVLHQVFKLGNLGYRTYSRVQNSGNHECACISARLLLLVLGW